jgi:integrase/recombinase XerD
VGGCSDEQLLVPCPDCAGAGEVRYWLGERLVDRYLEFVAGRSRPDTLQVVAFDLKVFFSVGAKDPAKVTATDVFDFLADQRSDRSVVRLADGELGLSVADDRPPPVVCVGPACVSGRPGDAPVRVNPVPRSLLTR